MKNRQKRSGFQPPGVKKGMDPEEWLDKFGWMLVHCMNGGRVHLGNQIASFRCPEGHVIVCAGCAMQSPLCLHPDCLKPLERMPHGMTYAKHQKEQQDKLLTVKVGEEDHDHESETES